MTVVMTCGHEDKTRPISGWPVKVKATGVNDYGVCPVVDHFVLCLDCYKKYLEDVPHLMMFHEWEEAAYLRGED